MKNKDPENIIKGRIGEVIAEEMFKELGFFVMRLGKENTVNPLTQMEHFVKSCNGNFCLEKLNMEIKEISQVNTLPDFFLVHPNGKAALLEVKFKWDALPRAHNFLVFQTYPEAHVLIINLEVKDEILIDEKYKDKLDILKQTRFHIWEKDQIPKPLYEWIKEEFGVENNEILERYAGYTKKWLGNEEVFKKF